MGRDQIVPCRPVRRVLLWVTCGFVALLLWPVSALAWKPVDHMYAANEAIAPIMANSTGHNYFVTLLGKNDPVLDQVGKSIHDYPNDYRGGVVGPDAFPDIVGGQGNVHPDTRADNGGKPQADWTPGHSYAYEWLALVYRSGWAAYNKCNGCAEGQKDLAFTYGYLTHAGEDMWGHTFINGFAKGVFPSVSEIGEKAERDIAIRHIVTEGYVGLHTPKTDVGIDAPTDFIYNTFMANPTAAALGRGKIIDHFLEERADLVKEVADLTNAIGGATTACVVHPLSCVERTYLERWIDDIDTGLKAYAKLSLDIAKDLFGQDEICSQNPVPGEPMCKANTTKLRDDITDFRNHDLISMLGAPDLAGYAATVVTFVNRYISSVLEPVIAPIQEIFADFENYIVKTATGFDLREWLGYLQSPATYIDNEKVNIGFNPATSKALNRLMGKPDAKRDETCTTINGPSCFDPSKFAAMNDTINMAKLILLNGTGLTSVLTAQNAAAYYLPDRKEFPQNIMVQVAPTGGMTGWIKSLDGDHQWMATAPDGKSYGIGRMALWKSCNSRPVFRALFTDWEHGTNNFPDSADPAPCAQTMAEGAPVNVTKPTIVFRIPLQCTGRPVVCGPGSLDVSLGTWTGGGALSYSYKWIRKSPGRCLHGCEVSSSSVYTLTKDDSDALLLGVVTASNEFGETATVTTNYQKVPTLDLTAPVVSSLTVRSPIGPIPTVTLTLSGPAGLTVTLATPTHVLPCNKSYTERPAVCHDYNVLEDNEARPVRGPPTGLLHVVAKAGPSIMSLRPFGPLSPGKYRVTFSPRDSVGNVGHDVSIDFVVPVRKPCPRPRGCS